MLIEQVVFAWSDMEGQPGGRVLGRSANISAGDLKEIAAWGPEHSVAAAPRLGAISFDCHPLASGAFCIGRTSVVSVRAPGRQRANDHRSLSLYTHCLVIPAEEALRYARHFPLILRAAEHAGAFRFGPEPPEKLQPLSIDHFQLAGVAGSDSLFAARQPNRKIAAHNQTPPRDAACNQLPPREAASSPAEAEPAHDDPALRQAHASHKRSADPAPRRTGAESCSPPQSEQAQPSRELARRSDAPSRHPDLAQLDAKVDAALEGDGGALRELASLWSAAEQELEPSLVEESCERYLRRASSVWTDYLNDTHDRGRSLASIEVLCLLLDV